MQWTASPFRCTLERRSTSSETDLGNGWLMIALTGVMLLAVLMTGISVIISSPYAFLCPTPEK
jgi:hypothetical protein